MSMFLKWLLPLNMLAMYIAIGFIISSCHSAQSWYPCSALYLCSNSVSMQHNQLSQFKCPLFIV